MSIIHDGWCDTGKLSNTPYLDLSIIPAVGINYLGLFGSTINIFNIETNLDDMNKISNPNNLTPETDLGNIESGLNLENKDNFGVQDLVNQLRGLNENR